MWTDASGQYHCQGRLVSVDRGVVRLQRADGRFVRVAFDKLCPTDQQFVERHLAAVAAAW